MVSDTFGAESGNGDGGISSKAGWVSSWSRMGAVAAICNDDSSCAVSAQISIFLETRKLHADV